MPALACQLCRWKEVGAAASAWLLLAWIGLADPVPPIGKIDLYGVRTVSAQAIRNQLGLRVGDPTPLEQQGQLELRLEQVPGVVKAKVTSVCCEEGKSTVFVGIQELAETPFHYRPSPKGSASLPSAVVQTYDQFMEALAQEVQQGHTSEDDSQGHPLYAGKALQPFTDQFQALARSQGDRLKLVLKTAADAKQRAIAAWILSYAPDKPSVLAELMGAVRDPDEGVRNNATRAIGTMAVLARAKPKQGIVIEPEVFIQMLNSLSWSDRNKAMMVLLQLTEDHAPEVLRKMREQALPSLIQMARWQDGHSLMALRLVGRIVGLEDKETFTAWQEGHRERVIGNALER